MHVIATAGHVDHGKSTLVRALTGMEPDRWAEERRRGMTIDLGYAWMTLPGGDQLAFVDVPGHERFVPNMLAGLGPVPAVMFVVAADGGWMPQSAEHLAAADALGVSHGLLVVTRADLADPGPALRAASAELAATSLGAVEAVAVSAVSGAGLDDLRAALARLAASLPAPDPGAPVRLWIDRSFTIRGSGTVVTGTLPAGTVAAGQELLLTPGKLAVRVRTVQALGEPAEQVTGVARVALNLRGVPTGVPGRGMALVTPGSWTLTSDVDVRITAGALGPPLKFPPELLLHVGSARTQALLRILGEQDDTGDQRVLHGSDAAVERRGSQAGPEAGPGAGTGVGPRAGTGTGPRAGPASAAGRRGFPAVYARLRLRDPLPLHAGDRVLLRDPGAAGLAIYGATVLDPAPPSLSRRGAAAAAARELATWPRIPTAADLLRRHRLLRASTLAAAGATGLPEPVAGDWLADPDHWARLRSELSAAVAAFAAKDPLAQGMPLDAARAALRLPHRDLVVALLTEPRRPAGSTAPATGTTAPATGTTAPATGTTAPATGTTAPATGTTAPATGAVAGATASASGAVAGATASTSGTAGVVLDGAYLRLATTRAPAGPGTASGAAAGFPPRVARAIQSVLDDLADDPFDAPDAERLRALGLDPKALAAAARAGLLLRVADVVVLAPGADKEAARLLAELPQPFTTSQARQALHTSRRVAIPLLEYLDRARVTERLPGDQRRLRPR